MSIPSLKARFSFQGKVLIPVVAVMVLLVTVIMWLINVRITSQLQSDAADQLDTAARVFQSAQSNFATQILKQYRTLVNEPRFKAVTRTAEPGTITGVLNDFLNEEDDARVIIFTAANGTRFASANHDLKLDVSEFESRSAAAIHAALAGDPKVVTIRVDDRLFDAVSVPVQGGAVTVGVDVGERMLAQVKQFTHSDIMFLMDDKVITSLDQPELVSQLSAHFRELIFPQPGAVAGAQALLQDHHLRCKAGYLGSISGESRIGYVLLSSYERPLLALRETQRRLLWVGMAGIALSTCTLWLIMIALTRPLRQLRDSAEAVGRGDFSHRVEVKSSDECGELAVVFNQMTQNLKASREQLEQTVQTLKTTQDQLIQSEKLAGIGEFVSGVAHELNNPLTSVMGFSELLQQTDMPESHRRYLDLIFKSAKRCQKIVQSLLSFARRHAPERKVLCVNEVVESAVEILQYQMRTSNIEVITQFDPRLPASLIDPHQMQQVFLNIINNARQALESRQTRGCVRITTEAIASRVRITFQDNGPGIPAENLKKIFNPFFTTKEVGKGTGLGLSICYGIVSEHGGLITPLSKPGEGATFIVELPVTDNAVVRLEPAPLSPTMIDSREGEGKRVLVIDDEDSILQMIQAALTVNGYNVDVARDGETALKRFSQYHYDLALCDWKMPGLSGRQVYERLRTSNPEMSSRLIFITGDVVTDRTRDYLSDSNKICLSKPFTLSEFRAAIGRMLSGGLKEDAV